MRRVVVSPFDQSPIGEVNLATKSEALALLARVHAQFQIDSSARSRLSANQHLSTVERIAILKRVAARIREQKNDYADLIALEGGKPIKDALVEVDRAAVSFEVAAESLANLSGATVSMTRTQAALGHWATTIYEPTGVVFAISAFNHPLNLIAHQIAPCIAAGCPVLIKPALETPLSCLRLVENVYKSGLPTEYCLPLIAENDVAEDVARSDRIQALSFIGSAKVGWHLRSIVAPGVRVQLEHGGAAPAVVEKSADLDLAVAQLVRSSFYHSGQVCVSTQRIFVERAIQNEFLSRFVHAVRGLKTGDARLPDTDCGPLIRVRDADRIERLVDDVRRVSAQSIVCGGARLSPSLYQPTVIVDGPTDVALMTEEAFGPVVAVQSFDRIESAIELANSVRWSFQAAVYTRDLGVALQCAQSLNGSAVMINEATTFRVDWMPFRGNGPSGLGTGGIPYAVRELLNEKMIVMGLK